MKLILDGSIAKIECLADETNTVLWARDPDYQKQLILSSNYRDIWQQKCIDIFRDPLKWRNYLIPEHQVNVYPILARRDTVNHPNHTQHYCINLPTNKKQWILDRCMRITDDYKNCFIVIGVALPVQSNQLAGEANQIMRELLNNTIIKFYEIIMQTAYIV